MFRSLFMSLTLIFILASSVSAEMVMIVNENNPVNHLSVHDIKKIYNGNFKLWENGEKIIAVDHPDTDPLTRLFTRKVLGVDIETRNMLQMQRIYAGASAPHHVEINCAKTITFVANEPGAIAYVDKKFVTGSVKIILINGKSEF